LFFFSLLRGRSSILCVPYHCVPSTDSFSSFFPPPFTSRTRFPTTPYALSDSMTASRDLGPRESILSPPQIEPDCFVSAAPTSSPPLLIDSLIRLGFSSSSVLAPGEMISALFSHHSVDFTPEESPVCFVLSQRSRWLGRSSRAAATLLSHPSAHQGAPRFSVSVLFSKFRFSIEGYLGVTFPSALALVFFHRSFLSGSPPS